MAKVSKDYRLKVVPHRPMRTWTLRCLAVLLVGGAVVGGYFYGSFHGGHSAMAAASEIERLNLALSASQLAEADLRQQMANLQMGAQVDRKASEDVRQEVIELKNQLAELQEENSFYRNLMAPSDNQEGLTFGAVEISDTDVARRFRFKVVLQQLATNHQLLNGALTVNIIGRQDGAVKVMPLSDLSDEVESANIKLRFKYFQTVQGQLQLPAGFEPERIELVARSTGSKPVTVEKRLGWLVRET